MVVIPHFELEPLLLAQAWGLLLLNGCFVATNVTGLIRWWYPAVSTMRST